MRFHKNMKGQIVRYGERVVVHLIDRKASPDDPFRTSPPGRVTGISADGLVTVIVGATLGQRIQRFQVPSRQIEAVPGGVQ